MEYTWKPALLPMIFRGATYDSGLAEEEGRGALGHARRAAHLQSLPGLLAGAVRLLGVERSHEERQ